MKRLILGDGLLGTALRRQASWDYISRKKDSFDFRDILTYKNLLNGYDEVINCISCTDTYSEERDEHWELNFEGVANLVDECNLHRIKLIHIVTDYIYSHSKVGVTEKDVPVHCANWYTYTKLLGDAYVQLRSRDYLLIRSTHKPEPFPYEEAWVNQIGNFDYVSAISELMIKLISKGSSGIYNVGTKVKTMYELAKRTKVDVKPNFVLADDTTPTNVVMDISKMESELAQS
jgi:dTDP-4-dehydrorhamnose reductase